MVAGAKATFLAPAAVIAALTLAACAPPVLTDDQKQPDAVRIGMSSRQVESLMGTSRRTCWIYERGEGVEEGVCFEDGMVHTIGRRTQKPGTNDVSIDAEFSDAWPPKRRPSPTATEVALGMAPADVARLKGKPSALVEYFSWRGGEYKATFRNGALTKFDDVPMPPIP
ncbi:MAG: hypothetical protein J0J01_27785 [Reyranella sp.]|uniref:hypothetical protein n=1 Tax=Reyranella sp. TaxID=1929291 RepID=UPI001AC21700|nr:hypothetical protein [Reyranella sp.]MBN9090731.1 hypothetical protein [Reyranella sp.]